MQLNRIGLLLLASGTGSRFAEQDKLLASLAGRPVLAHAAGLLQSRDAGTRLAVVGAVQRDRAKCLAEAGFRVIANDAPELGQGRSLGLGICELRDHTDVDAAMILLADMPLVPESHLVDLAHAMTDGVEAVMTEVDGVLMPPALFSRASFDALSRLEGDTGARSVFKRLDQTRVVSLHARYAADVDTPDDLEALEANLNG